MVILRQRWLPLAVAAVSFLSAQQAEAAGLLSLPFCVANCVQKSSTCKATDTKCLCRATREDEKFLPTVAACIRDECESSLSLGTLLIPLRTSCLLFGLPIPHSAISEGNAVLKEPPTSTTKSASASTTAKVTATSAKSTATTTTAPTTQRTTTAIPSAPPLTTASPASSPTTTAAATTSTSTSTTASPEATAGTSLTTSPRVIPSSSPVVDGSKGDNGDKLETDPFAAPEKSASSRTGRKVPLLTSTLISSTAAILFVWVWS
ncbi:hypothetical protein PG985_007244 [Apiospora marii]|uniref:CFEM domain-containing protein n=1 Tax=Apiospora marii TaxID=335849 RepID=A0ABR1SEM3_9PEZI